MSTWRLQVRDPRGIAHDVFVDAAAQSTTASLAEQLDQLGWRARPFGLRGRPLTEAVTLSDAELEHGDVITVGILDPLPAPPGVGWYVVAVSGPDAGRWAPLRSGSATVVGRDARGLTIDDPLMSAEHCSLTLADGEVTLADLGSTNGTALEQTDVVAAERVMPGQYFQVGSTVLTVVELTADDLAVLGALDGPARVLPRQYRRALPELPTRMEAPRAADDDSPSSASTWWRALVPIISGAGFAAMTGRWIFLLIMAIAPIIVAIDTYRRRKGTNVIAARKRARHDEEIAAFEQRLAELRTVERARRRTSAAIGGLSAFAATARTSVLWQRLPDDDDFLTVGVGLADMPSSIAATGRDSALMWGTPVSNNLVSTGSLAVVGEQQRVRAVARGLLLSLAAHHSPSDLQVTIITDDPDGEQWGFARWLPHTARDETVQGVGGCRIGADSEGRARLLASVAQLLVTRREMAADAPAAAGRAVAPTHLVVVDDTNLVTASELTELLVDGPALGIVGMTLDARLAPEGAGATLTVTASADTCVFQSRHQPRVEGVAVAQVGEVAADAAARRLAGLRPTVSETRALDSGTVHLVDLIERSSAQPLDGAEVAQRWASISPRTDVLVGVAAGTPMRIDLVRDGPHGLVGGTSGSGKTEFLKTLFCSLALNNHPDDLSIVVVDFKGGVDHEAIKPLPHVIDVATNLDIEQFRRTIVLLKAESRRRQDLLSGAGASNIDSYRLARAANPALPRLPRLLVVVDEFGELLASEGGREQLKELESITRIGRALGVHLLLVTQNFDGNLPPQIDANAGLRVCLRVQKPAHSKAVLDSGVAATISDSDVGRAYARFHGRDLTEFQTARVAGRRRDLVVEATSVSVRLSSFSALALPGVAVRPDDVPADETDLNVIVQAVRAAAEAAGWTRSAVPWPAALPQHVSLAALAARRSATDDGVPIGLADVPGEQCRRLVALDGRDQQVALLGGPAAPLPDVLAMYATSLALSRPADDAHLYVIDLLGRGLAPLAELPHCGAVAVRNEALALRIIRWLTQAAAERKVQIAASGSSTVWEHETATGESVPQLVLLVSGAERLLGADGAGANVLGPLMSLMSESVGVGIQIVLSGLPKIVGHRLGMNIDKRFVFQLADVSELGGAGVPKAVAADLRVERRAYETGVGQLVQIARLGEPGSAEGATIRAVAARLSHAVQRPPKRFADVSWPLPWDQAPFERMALPAHLVAPLPVGVGADDGEWLWLDASDDGPVFAVTGPPKSGRSSALAAIGRLASMQGLPVLNVALSRRSPLTSAADPWLSHRVSPDQLGDAIGAAAGTLVVLIDDLQRLTEPTCIEAAMAHRGRVLLVVAGSPDLLGSRMGVLRSLPTASSGLLLAPTGSLDGSAIGLRRLPAEWTSNPRPGRGILAIAGEAAEIQVPLVALNQTPNAVSHDHAQAEIS